MNLQKLLKRANIVRSAGNAHRFICRINGRLFTFSTHEKDFANNLAALFSNLNACFSSSAAAIQTVAVAASLVAMLGSSVPAFALPTGGESISGGGVITQPDASTLNVTTSAAKAIMQWQTFNVWRGETVNFLLPSSSASILNRVIGGSPSQIFGAINSNGHVFLVNPSGIIFGPSAQVNVGSLFASTMNISNHDFLSGNYVFRQDPGHSPAFVINQGDIAIAKGGFAVLAGGHVENSGNITAPEGTVALAVGNQVSLAMDNDLGVKVTVDEALKQNIQDYTDAVKNTGLLKADGGLVQLQAKLEGNLYEHAVNNSGRVEAQSVAFKNGQIEFFGSSTDGSALVENTGTVDASGTVANADAGHIKIEGDTSVAGGNLLASGATGGKGGKIEVVGDNVALLGTADASGDVGGGTVLVGGDLHGQGDTRTAKNTYVDQNAKIDVSARTNGDGGKAVVWSDNNTEFQGTILAKGGSQSGNGGQVEVSGKENLVFRGFVDASSAHGKAGSLLLDPKNITIATAASVPGGTVSVNPSGTAHLQSGVTTYTPVGTYSFRLNGVSSTTFTVVTTVTDPGSNAVLYTKTENITYTGSVPGATVTNFVASGSAFTVPASYAGNNIKITQTISVQSTVVSGSFSSSGLSLSYAGSGGGAAIASNKLFSDNPSSSVTITPDSIQAITNTGTALTLQANNDVTVTDAITTAHTGGATKGGDLTLQAGRDINVNANITTDNGNLALTANDHNAPSNRDPGTGNINMATGASINAGTGNVTLTVDSGSSASATPGNINLSNVTGNNVTLNNSTGSGNITQNSGTAINAAGTLSINTNTGNATQDGSATGAALAASVNSLTANSQSGTIKVVDADSLTLNASNLNSGNLEVTTNNGGININGTVSAANANLTTKETSEATGADISGTGKLVSSGNAVLKSADNINVKTDANNLTAKADGNVTIAEDNAVTLVTAADSTANQAGSDFSVNASSITVNGKVSSGTNGTGNINLTADKLDINAVAGGITLDSNWNKVNLKSKSDETVQVAGATDDADSAGVLDISNAELGRIGNTGTVVIGDTTTNLTHALNLQGSIDLTNGSLHFNNLDLKNAQDITNNGHTDISLIGNMADNHAINLIAGRDIFLQGNRNASNIINSFKLSTVDAGRNVDISRSTAIGQTPSQQDIVIDYKANGATGHFNVQNDAGAISISSNLVGQTGINLHSTNGVTVSGSATAANGAIDVNASHGNVTLGGGSSANGNLGVVAGDGSVSTKDLTSSTGSVNVETHGAGHTLAVTGKVDAATSASLTTDGASSGISVTNGIDPTTVTVTTSGDNSSIDIAGGVTATQGVQLATNGNNSHIHVTSGGVSSGSAIGVDNLSITTSGNNADIQVTGNVNGDNVTMQTANSDASQLNSGISVNGSVTAGNNLELLTNASKIDITGDINSNGGAGTHTWLQAGTSNGAGGYFFDVSGNLNIASNAGKDVVISAYGGDTNSILGNGFFSHLNHSFNNFSLTANNQVVTLDGTGLTANNINLTSYSGLAAGSNAFTLYTNNLRLASYGALGSAALPIRIASSLPLGTTNLALYDSGAGANAYLNQVQGNLNITGAGPNALFEGNTLNVLSSGSLSIGGNVFAGNNIVANTLSLQTQNNGDINLNASTQVNGTGTIAADGLGNVNLNRSLTGSASQVNVSGHDINMNSSINLNGSLTANADHNLTNIGSVQLGGTLTGTAHNNISHSGGSLNAHTVNLTADNDILIDGTGNNAVNHNSNDPNSSLWQFSSTQPGGISATNTSLKAGRDITNNKAYLNGSTIDLTAGRDISNSGLIYAGSSANLQAGRSIFLNNGSLWNILGNSTLTAGTNTTDTDQGNITLSALSDVRNLTGSTTLNAEGDISVNNSIVVSSGSNVSANAGGALNNSGIIQAAGTVDLTAGGKITNDNLIKGQGDVSLTSTNGGIANNKEIASGGKTTLKAKGDISSSYFINGSGDVTITSTAGDVTLGGTTQAAGGDVKVSGKNITSNSSVVAGGGIQMDATGTLTNNNNMQANVGAIKLTSDGDLTNNSGIWNNFADDITLTSNNGKVTNTGDITSGRSTTATYDSPTGNITLDGETGVTNTGTVTSKYGHIAVTSDNGDITNNNSLTARNDLSLTVKGAHDIKGTGTFKADNLNVSLEQGDATTDGTSTGAALNADVNTLAVNNAAAATGTVKVTDKDGVSLQASNVHGGSLSVTETGTSGAVTLSDNVNGANVDLHASGSGNITEAAGKTLTANNLTLSTVSGNIGGSASDKLNINTNNLTLNSTSGNAFIHDPDAITLLASTVGGDLNVDPTSITVAGAQNVGGNIDLTASDSITLNALLKSNTGNITLTANNLDINAISGGKTIQTAHTLLIQPYGNNVPLHFGGSADNGDVAGANPVLDISAPELGRIKAGNVLFGSSANTGDITVGGDLILDALGYDLTLQTGGSIQSNNHILARGLFNGKELRLDAGQDVTLTTNGDFRPLYLTSVNAGGNVTMKTNGFLSSINVSESVDPTNVDIETWGLLSPITIGGNVDANGNLTMLTRYGNIWVGGNITNLGGAGKTTTLVAGDYAYNSNNNDISLGGSLSVADGGNLTVRQDNGNVFSKAFFAGTHTLNDVQLFNRSGLTLGGTWNVASLSAATADNNHALTLNGALNATNDVYLATLGGGSSNINLNGNLTANRTVLFLQNSGNVTQGAGSLIKTNNLTLQSNANGNFGSSSLLNVVGTGAPDANPFALAVKTGGSVYLGTHQLWLEGANLGNGTLYVSASGSIVQKNTNTSPFLSLGSNGTFSIITDPTAQPTTAGQVSAGNGSIYLLSGVGAGQGAIGQESGAKLLANRVVLNSDQNIYGSSASNPLQTSANELTVHADLLSNVQNQGSVQLKNVTDPVTGLAINNGGGTYQVSTANGSITVKNDVTASSIKLNAQETASATNSNITSDGGKLIATGNTTLTTADNINVQTQTDSLSANGNTVHVDETDGVVLKTVNGVSNTASGLYEVIANGAVDAQSNVTSTNGSIHLQANGAASDVKTSGGSKLVATNGSVTVKAGNDVNIATNAAYLAANAGHNVNVTEDDAITLRTDTLGNANAADDVTNGAGNNFHVKTNNGSITVGDSADAVSDNVTAANIGLETNWVPTTHQEPIKVFGITIGYRTVQDPKSVNTDITTAGGASLNASGNTALRAKDGNVNVDTATGSLSASGTNVTVREADAVTLLTSPVGSALPGVKNEASGNYKLNANGTISVANDLNADNIILDAGTANITSTGGKLKADHNVTLNSNGGDINVTTKAESLSTHGGNVNVQEDNNIVLKDSPTAAGVTNSATGNYTVTTTDGSITAQNNVTANNITLKAGDPSGLLEGIGHVLGLDHDSDITTQGAAKLIATGNTHLETDDYVNVHTQTNTLTANGYHVNVTEDNGVTLVDNNGLGNGADTSFKLNTLNGGINVQNDVNAFNIELNAQETAAATNSNITSTGGKLNGTIVSLKTGDDVNVNTDAGFLSAQGHQVTVHEDDNVILADNLSTGVTNKADTTYKVTTDNGSITAVNDVNANRIILKANSTSAAADIKTVGSASLNATGNTTLKADGNVDVNTRTQSLTANANGDVTVREADDVVLKDNAEGLGNQAGGTYTLTTANGAIKLQDNVKAATIKLTTNETAEGDNHNADISGNGKLITDTGLVVLNSADNIDVNTKTGTLTANAAGNVTVNEADDVSLVTTGALENAAGKNYSVTSNHGSIGIMNNVTAGKDILLDANDNVTNSAAILSTDGDVTVNAHHGDITNNATSSITADKGALTLQADHDIFNIGNLVAKRLVSLDAGHNIQNNIIGNITSNKDDVTMNAGNDISNDGHISADKNLNVTAKGNITNGTNLALSKISDTASLSAKMAVNLNAKDGSITNASVGDIHGGSVTGHAGTDVNNYGTVTADNKLKLTADNNINNTGTLDAGSDLVLKAGQNEGNDGEGGPVFSLLAAVAPTGGNINNSGTAVSHHGDVKFHATEDIDNSGTVKAKDGNVNLKAGADIYNDEKGSIVSKTGDVTLKAGEDITNDGLIRAGNDLIAHAGGDVNNGTYIVQNPEEGGEGDNATARMIAGHNVKLNAGDDINNAWAGRIKADNNVVLNAGDDIHNNGKVKAGNNVNADAEDNINNQGRINAGHNVNLDAGWNIKNSGNIHADNTFSALAGNNIRNSGVIRSGGDSWLLALDGDIRNTESGRIHADGNANLIGANIYNAGTIRGYRANLGAIGYGFAPELRAASINGEGNVLFYALGRLLTQSGGRIVNSGLITAASSSEGSPEVRLALNESEGEGPGSTLFDQIFGAHAVNMVSNGNIRVTQTGEVYGDNINMLAFNNIRVAGQVGNDNTQNVNMLAFHNVTVAGNGQGDCCDVRDNAPTEDGNGRVFGSNINLLAGIPSNPEVLFTGGGLNQLTFATGGHIKINGFVGDTSSSNVNVHAYGDVYGEGRVTGDTVNVTSDQGNIGRTVNEFPVKPLLAFEGEGSESDAPQPVSVIHPLWTSANNLSLNAQNGSVDVNQLGSVNLLASAAKNNFDLTVLPLSTVCVYGPNVANLFVQGGVTGNNINLTTTNGSIGGPGLIAGNNINLLAQGGNIDSNTDANFLTYHADGDSHIHELNDVTTGDGSAGGLNFLSVGGNLTGQGILSGHNVQVFAGGNILDGNGSGLNLYSTGDSILSAGGVIGLFSDPFDVNVGGKLSVGAGGQIRGVSVDIDGSTGDNTLHLLGNRIPPGAVIFNGRYLFGGGPINDLFHDGIPYMVQNFNNLTNPLFSTGKDLNGKLLTPDATRGVIAQIINNWHKPEPFDLRLLQDQNDQGGETYELLMNSDH